jgi:glycosyltransferase involved in cell wall biosynthesis
MLLNVGHRKRFGPWLNLVAEAPGDWLRLCGAAPAGTINSVDRRRLVAEARVRPDAYSGPVKVLALTKYGRLGASSRCRFLNYIPLLRSRNISVTEAPLLSDTYVRQRLAGSHTDYRDVSRSYISRLATIVSAFRFDVLWIEGELLPRWPAAIERLLSLLGARFIVDLDDAIFHTYDRHPNPLLRGLLGRKIDVILNRATTVVAGNEYLAERARQAGARRTVMVPTTVDHLGYADQKPSAHDKLTFGWIGSPATTHYLQTIATELEEVCYSHQARLRLIGIERHCLKYPDVVLSNWSEDTELAELAACDIGLAPLYDGPWERGKCGLKAIQYMAIGIPVLAADAGVLPTIIRHGETGFVYRDGTEFTRFAHQLANEPELRRCMGASGRERVAARYSIHGWADTIADLLVDAASH